MRYRYDIERVTRRWLTGEVVVAFIFGTILLGIFTNAAYDLVTMWSGVTANDLIKLLILTAVVGIAPIAFVAHRLQRAREPNPETKLGGERDVTQGHRGLILLVSNRDMARFSIRHHLYPASGNALERCWLICTTEMADLCGLIAEDFAPEHFPALEVSPVSIQGAFLAPDVHKAVVDLIAAATDPTQDAPFTAANLIVDITGGTKPMTAGAVLASIQSGVAMQYVESRWAAGKPVSGTQVAKIVEVITSGATVRTAESTPAKATTT